MSEFLLGANSASALDIKALIFLLLTDFVFQTKSQTAQAQTAPIVESGKFRLHKFEQPIGEETYEITREDNSPLSKNV